MSADRTVLSRGARIGRIGALSVLVVLCVLGAYRYFAEPLQRGTAPVTVRITLGSGPERISEALAAVGIDRPAWQIALALRIRGDVHALKAAHYEIPPGMPLAGLLDRITRGEGRLSEFRIIEGWTFAQVRQAAAKHPDLAQDTRDLSAAQLRELLGIRHDSAEGLLAPDTYRFAPGMSERHVYRRAIDAMRKVLDQAWAGRAADLPLASPYEALVLASMIEKETGLDQDRALIAGVFVNRLQRGMRLQSDPTTIYALGDAFSGRLTRADLQRALPHNTYVIAGLPPTPIALPGRASIEAALQPTRTRALYFVARGDGSSEFSEDLAAHQRAVNRFLKGRP